MPRRKYRRFTADQKVTILREHLLEKTPISDGLRQTQPAT